MTDGSLVVVILVGVSIVTTTGCGEDVFLDLKSDMLGKDDGRDKLNGQLWGHGERTSREQTAGIGRLSHGLNELVIPGLRVEICS